MTLESQNCHDLMKVESPNCHDKMKVESPNCNEIRIKAVMKLETHTVMI